MTNEEAKQAFLKQCPVVNTNPLHGLNAVYECISALIYRVKGSGTVLSVELKDRNTHSVTIADPQYIFKWEG